MAARCILTVEDDPAIRRGIVDALTYAGYQVVEAGNGDDGLKMAVQRSYDLLLLDLVLPGKSGLEILDEVRATRPTQPVIILTARGEENDRVEGLRKGADDYVVKPFSVKELLARVEAVLRRSPERPTDVEQVAVPGGVADFARRGETVSYEEVLAQQNLRDQRDSDREAGPLLRADDAVTVSTDGLVSEEVVDQLETLVRKHVQAK